MSSDKFSQNIMLSSGELQQEKEYWLKKLDGDLNLTGFEPEFSRTSPYQYQGHVWEQEFTGALSKKLYTITKRSEYGLFIILLAAVKYLLYRYTGNETVTVGMPVFGRETQSVNHTVLLQSAIHEENTFKEWLLTIRNTVTEADEHANFPIGILAETFHLEQNEEFVRINTMVMLEPIHDRKHLEKVRFDLLFGFVMTEKSIGLQLAYNSLLYTKDLIRQISRHLINILEAVTGDPNLSLERITFMSAEEEQQLLQGFGSFGVDYPRDKTLQKLFEEQVERTPAHIAVVCEEQQISFRELNEQANRLAATLRRHGAGPDQLIGIMAERSLEMIIGMMAVLKAGSAYLPIDPDYPVDRIRYMLEDSGARVLLTQSHLTHRVEGSEGAVTLLDLMDESLYSGAPVNPPIVNQPSDLAYVIYTSGTTGKSKGAMIEHRNVVRLMFNDSFQFDFNDHDVWTMFHSFCFDFSVWEIYGALLYGGKLVIVPKPVAQDPAGFLDLLKSQRVTVLNQTPTAFYSLIHEEMSAPGRDLVIRYVIFGGEALKPLMLKGWRERYPGTKLVNMYGITETTVHVTYKEITEKEIALGISNIGKPIPTLTTYILDRKLQLMPIGAVGELCVGGDGVGRGYLNRPELTETKFVMNPFGGVGATGRSPVQGRLYRSGDLARILPNGDMEYFGRMDHQVKIRGHRIELGEIESVMLGLPPVKEAVALALDDSAKNKYICAWYVAEQELTVPEIRGYLATKLPGYMIPSFFIRLPKLPMTANNKLDRKALPVPDGEVNTGEEYEAPRNDTEEKMVLLWQEVLNVAKAGINGNFFNLGGDSIKAIRLINRMNTVLGTNFLVKDLYLHQTIKELLAHSDYSAAHEMEEELQTGRQEIDRFRESVLADEKLRGKLPEGYEDFYPLSPIQQGMVFFTRLMPEEPIYHDQFPYLVRVEQFDRGVFSTALRLLIRKHQILRTTFCLEEFVRPVQIVHQPESGIVPDLVVEDLTQLDPKAQEDKIKVYMARDLQEKFKLDGDLLWRLRGFQLGPENYAFVLSFQHAVLDGWSVASLMSELFSVYEVMRKGESCDTGRLQTSYRDYVALNLSRQASETIRAFWKENLKGYTRNKLPFNISNKKINNINGSRILRREIGGNGLLPALEAYAKTSMCTVKEICLAAHIYLMGLLSMEEDVVTGMVTHDRPPLPDSDKILGCFLNTIPVRVKTSNVIKKTALLEAAKKAGREAKAHELFLAEIAGYIGESGGSGNPIFDTLLNYTDFHVMKSLEESGTVVLAENGIELHSNEMTNTLFDLEVSKTLDVLVLQIKYSPNYFYDEEIETAFELYIRVLRAMTMENDAYLRSERLLTEAEFREIVYDFNETRIPYPKEKTMHQLFEEQVLQTPENVALVLEDKQLTYRELNEKANQLARILMEKGVCSGDHVALITQRNFEMIIGMLAILKCGGAYVPVDPEYPEARQKYIAENSNIKALVVDQGYDFTHPNTVVIDGAEMSRYSSANIGLAKDSKDLAYVIYTSGSTGVPKGVMIEHHSAVNLILWVNKTFHVGGNDALLFITSMCFDLSVYDIFGTLAAGGRVVIARKEQVQNPDELKMLLTQNRITFWDSVPSTMNYLVNTLEETDSSFRQTDLRLVFMSGDWIPVKLPDRLRTYFPNTRVISLGGATEGTVWSIFYPVEKVGEHWSSIPYGRPMDNNYFYILDKHHGVVPKGVAGELYIGGVGVARGYMNNEEKTRASFMPNRFFTAPDEMMYKTGDLGRMLPGGNIEFLGRIDHQVKIRGYRVELGEIENKLLKHPAVKDTVVVDKTDTGGAKYLCAYIVWHEERTVAEMREYLAGELPDYMIPTYFVGIEQIPLTVNGKVDRKSLPEPTGAIHTGVEYVPPRDELEAELAKIWQEVLEVERVSIKDNFFELGGHSLKATTLVSRVHKQFNLELSLREALSHQTVVEMADLLRTKQEQIDELERMLAEIENLSDEEVERLLAEQENKDQG